MNNFIENHCRFCPKVFCCIKCRTNHEINIHKINKDCEICMRGKAFIKDFTPELLEHIRNTHLPLNCVNCRKSFSNIDELQNKECKQHSIHDTETPNQSNGTPFALWNLMAPSSKKIAHSTPLLSISPDNYMLVPKLDEKSSIKASDSKKRVTFSETPVTESKIELEETGELFYTAQDEEQEFKRHPSFSSSHPQTPTQENSGLWTSMKSFFSGLKLKPGKRSLENPEEEAPTCKRMKFIDLKSRPSIRHFTALETMRFQRLLNYVDKSTQTDF